jgi:uncharacterized protein
VAIEFDPEKDMVNRSKHGFPLIAAQAVFEGPFIEEEDRRYPYGETRFIAIGPIAALDNRLFVAVYTWRDGKRRIINFRKANDREARKYRDRHP